MLTRKRSAAECRAPAYAARLRIDLIDIVELAGEAMAMKGTWIRQAQTGAVVVFIHGIFGTAETWKHENGTYWPDLLVSDQDASGIGVYVFEYNTGFFTGSYRLGDVVDSLANHLRLDGVLIAKRIIFVCHSMGGIVARRFVVRKEADLARQGTEIGLFLIASPSLGAKYATWLSPLARAVNHSQADALRFSQDNSWLLDLDNDFRDLKEERRLKIHGKELVEDKFVILRIFGFKQVVEPFSGARYFGNPYKVPESTHFSIARVEGSNSIQYRLLIEFLYEMEGGAPPLRTAAGSTGGLAIGFPDGTHADIVKCRIAVNALSATHATLTIDWSEDAQKYLALTKQLLEEASGYLRSTSSFYGQPPDQIAEFVSRATHAITISTKIMTHGSSRAALLSEGMFGYWGIFDQVTSRSLANFLTICNVEIIYTNIALLRDKLFISKYFPRHRESWFAVDYHHKIFREVFSVSEKLAHAKISEISGHRVDAWFWGPEHEVQETAAWRDGDAVKGTWIDRYLIPQNEYRLLQEGSSDIIGYNETSIVTIKVTNDAGAEIA